MKKAIVSLVTLASFLASPVTAMAQDNPEGQIMKVIKVKKNTAVVVFSKKGAPLKVGQVGRLMPKKIEGQDEIEGVSRDRFIGMDASLSMLQTKADGAAEAAKVDTVDASVTYGWNKERFEYGALLGYRFEKYAASDVRTIELGGILDFNLAPNVIENDMIFGGRLVATIGDEDNSSQSAGARAIRIEPGAFVKWFGLSTNLAATATLSYRMKSVSYESSKSTTSGIVGRIGLQAYF